MLVTIQSDTSRDELICLRALQLWLGHMHVYTVIGTSEMNDEVKI